MDVNPPGDPEWIPQALVLLEQREPRMPQTIGLIFPRGCTGSEIPRIHGMSEKSVDLKKLGGSHERS